VGHLIYTEAAGLVSLASHVTNLNKKNGHRHLQEKENFQCLINVVTWIILLCFHDVNKTKIISSSLKLCS